MSADKNFSLRILGVALFLFGGIASLLLLKDTQPVGAAAPTGAQTGWATSSLIAANPTEAVTAFATSTCTSRVVTTGPRNVRLIFGDQATAPSATFGHLQAASTTVAYDGGIYGCGKVRVYGFDEANNITVSEFSGFR